MMALINETNNVRSNLQDLLQMLKQKIEDTIMEERSICVSIESSFINSLDKIYVFDDYEVNEESIHLSSDNLEFNINLNEITSFTYVDIDEEYFRIEHISNAVVYLFV